MGLQDEAKCFETTWQSDLSAKTSLHFYVSVSVLNLLKSNRLTQSAIEGLSGKRGQLFLKPQKVKGQRSIFIVKQAIMFKVQQLKLY